MHSTIVTPPRRLQFREQRGSLPPSGTVRAPTSSISYSSRSRSSAYGNGPTEPNEATAPMTTDQTRSDLDFRTHRSGLRLTRVTSPMPPSPADETLANCPNGYDASLTGRHYSTPTMMDPE